MQFSLRLSWHLPVGVFQVWRIAESLGKLVKDSDDWALTQIYILNHPGGEGGLPALRPLFCLYQLFQCCHPILWLFITLYVPKLMYSNSDHSLDLCRLLCPGIDTCSSYSLPDFSISDNSDHILSFPWLSSLFHTPNPVR